MESMEDEDSDDDLEEMENQGDKFKGSLINLDSENNTLLYFEFQKVGLAQNKDKEYSQEQVNDIINSIQY